VFHFRKWGRKSPIKWRLSSPPGEIERRLPDLPPKAVWGTLGGELEGDASLPDLPFFSPRREMTKPPCDFEDFSRSLIPLNYLLKLAGTQE
jgi:hypothetical protein